MLGNYVIPFVLHTHIYFRSGIVACDKNIWNASINLKQEKKIESECDGIKVLSVNVIVLGMWVISSKMLALFSYWFYWFTAEFLNIQFISIQWILVVSYWTGNRMFYISKYSINLMNSFEYFFECFNVGRCL